MKRNDLSIYSQYAHEWWQPRSPRFRSLQAITPFRLSLVEELCGDLKERDVLDLGCGGGLIAIPLIECGARVVGVDRSADSIDVVKKKACGQGSFITADITDVPLPSESADCVLLADVLDHIPQYPLALSEAARLVRPGGLVFVGTINRTIWSWFFAIFLGEGLRLIPPGTHDYSLFIKPEELLSHAKAVGLTYIAVQGERPLILASLKGWAVLLSKSKSTSIAYSMVFQKNIT